MANIPPMEIPKIIEQEDRWAVLQHPVRRSFRKTARILAIPMDKPFSVRTEHGVMRGEAGDWLATNHPDDDPGSDLWLISNARMKATYQEVEVE